MATVDELQELYDLGPQNDLDDATLGALIDTVGVYGALSRLWEERASKTATLVDVTESGSSRKLSGIHSQAVAMASRYRILAAATSPILNAANTASSRRITR